MREMIGGPLRFSPVIRRELISRSLKRFLFCTVIIMHVSLFLLPLLWYLGKAWLTPPPPKVIEVTLVSEPTSDPRSSRGTRASSSKRRSDSTKDMPLPPGEVADISKDIPNTPDVPDISKIKPRPKPRPKKRTVPKTAVKKNVKPTPQVSKKTTPAPVKKTVKKNMVDEIREWRRKQGGKTIKTVKNTGSRSGSSSAQTRNQLAKDIQGVIGNGGTADLGAGGVYDSYIPILIDFIQREWKRVAPPDLGTKVVVPLYFDISGNGSILSSSIKKRSGISVLDAAVATLLRTMRRLPAPPDGKRCQFTINLRVGEE